MIGPHFHKGKFGVHRNGKQGQGHTDVVVQVAMGGMNLQFLAEHGFDELFGCGFTGASCQAKYRGFEPTPVLPGQLLQRHQTTFHRHNAVAMQSRVVNDSSDASFGYGFVGKLISIEPLSFQSDIQQSGTTFSGVRGDAFRAIEERKKLLWRCAFHGGKKQRTPLGPEAKRGSE